MVRIHPGPHFKIDMYKGYHHDIENGKKEGTIGLCCVVHADYICVKCKATSCEVCAYIEYNDFHLVEDCPGKWYPSHFFDCNKDLLEDF